MQLITENGLLGISWQICGMICIGIAILYFFLWPKKLNPNGISYFILRYFHSLVWVLLAIYCFIANSKPESLSTATLLPKVALILYVVFIVTFLSKKNK
jgi:hypothetical protein